MDESWMLDELAHAGAEHLDDGFIAGFDRKQGYPDPDADIAAFDAHGLGSASVVADLGTGTGQFAIPAARRFGRVIAVDVSPAMLAALRAKADRDSLANLTVERAGFLGFSPGSPVDGVFTRNALHQLPDFWKAVALQRIADMLRPGGVLRLRDLVYDFTPAEAEEMFAGWFAAAATDPHGGGLRGAHTHRVQHLPVAARADAGGGGVRDRRCQLRAATLRRLHLRQDRLTGCRPLAARYARYAR
jgi:SAM-dependent methyltransferase